MFQVAIHNPLTILSLLLTFIISGTASATNIPVVIVDPVKESQTNETRALIGQVIAIEGGIIATEVAGKVETVAVKVGDSVDKDGVLTFLDSTRLRLRKDLAAAKVEIYQAKNLQADLEHSQAKTELNRQAELRGSPAFSKAIYENLENSLATSEAILEASKADLSEQQTNLEIASFNLDQATIRAPYPGIVTKKLVQPGVYVSPGDAIVELINIDNLEIELHIPKEQKKAIQKSKTVQLKLDNGTLHPAILRKLVLAENTVSRTLTARFIPVSPKPNLIAKQSITVLIPTASTKNILSMHKDALLQKNGGFYVFAVHENTAVIKPIVIGGSIDDRIEIIRGLNLNDLVVIRGNERLIPGQEISYEEKK